MDWFTQKAKRENMGILKDLKEAVAPKEATETVAEAVETAKSIEQITAESAAKFPAASGTGDSETPAPKTRKPRSDTGIKRGPKGMGKSFPQDAALASAQNGQAAAYTIDKQIVEKTAATVLHTIDGVLVRKVGTLVIKLGGDVDLAKEMAQDSGLNQGECQLMSELTGVIFEKHGLLTGYAPEILLTILLSEWGVRVSLTLRKLNAMADALEKKKRVSSPPSD